MSIIVQRSEEDLVNANALWGRGIRINEVDLPWSSSRLKSSGVDSWPVDIDTRWLTGLVSPWRHRARHTVTTATDSRPRGAAKITYYHPRSVSMERGYFCSSLGRAPLCVARGHPSITCYPTRPSSSHTHWNPLKVEMTSAGAGSTTVSCNKWLCAVLLCDVTAHFSRSPCTLISLLMMNVHANERAIPVGREGIC